MDANQINIIYDNRQSDDYERLLTEFSEQGIYDYHFWEAICDKNSVVESINASHKMIVQWAKEKKLPYVIIAEQDLTFTAKGAWRYFLKNKPKHYDLYLWGTYSMPLSNRMVVGFQLYCISEHFYDSFLSVPRNVHIDTEMDNLKGDYHFCYPFPALQRKGYSFNNRAIADYNVLLKPEDIWQGNPS